MSDKHNGLKELVSNHQKILICMHDFPDPDCLGASLGLKLMIEQLFDKSVILIGSGVSHPQNRTMVNLLNIPMVTPDEWISATQSHENELVIWVDFNPNSSNNKNLLERTHLSKPSWVIDHHIDKQLTGWHIETVGSTCTLIAEYMHELGFVWDRESIEHGVVSTAMMLGIMTDTNNLLSTSVTPRDLKAFEHLKQYYDQGLFTSVMDYELNPYFFDLMARVYETRVKEGPIIVLCLGYLKEERRDAIPFIADMWRRCKDISIVIAFAIINNTVAGSVRIKGSGEMKASDLAREIFKSPDSGGHAHMAGGRAKFGPFFDLELLDDETKRDFLHAVMKIIVSRAKNLAQVDE